MTRKHYIRVLALATALASGSVGASRPPPLGVRPPDESRPPQVDQAQVPGGLRPESNPYALFQSREIRSELDLSRQQLHALERSKRLFLSQREEARTLSGPDAQRQLEQLAWSSRGAIANVLTPAQLERFRQIVLQVEGPCLIPADDAMIQELAIDESQRSRLEKGCRDLAADLRAAFRKPPEGASDPCPALRDNQRRLDAIRIEGEQALLGLLSPRQQQQLKELQGKPVQFGPRPLPGCDPVPE